MDISDLIGERSFYVVEDRTLKVVLDLLDEGGLLWKVEVAALRLMQALDQSTQSKLELKRYEVIWMIFLTNPPSIYDSDINYFLFVHLRSNLTVRIKDLGKLDLVKIRNS